MPCESVNRERSRAGEATPCRHPFAGFRLRVGTLAVGRRLLGQPGCSDRSGRGAGRGSSRSAPEPRSCPSPRRASLADVAHRQWLARGPRCAPRAGGNGGRVAPLSGGSQSDAFRAAPARSRDRGRPLEEQLGGAAILAERSGSREPTGPERLQRLGRLGRERKRGPVDSPRTEARNRRPRLLWRDHDRGASLAAGGHRPSANSTGTGSRRDCDRGKLDRGVRGAAGDGGRSANRGGCGAGCVCRLSPLPSLLLARSRRSRALAHGRRTRSRRRLREGDLLDRADRAGRALPAAPASVVVGCRGPGDSAFLRPPRRTGAGGRLRGRRSSRTIRVGGVRRSRPRSGPRLTGHGSPLSRTLASAHREGAGQGHPRRLACGSGPVFPLGIERGPDRARAGSRWRR